jgi:two-component system, cell cycle sensor histidine kinase and response regulator CckA
VVDDDADVTGVLRRALTHLGFDVLTAADGAAGVAAFAEERASIVAILLDMTMPSMNGVEAFAAIRAVVRAVPVIIVSGFGEEDTIEKFGPSPPSAFLQKPFTLADVEHVIRKVVAGGS